MSLEVTVAHGTGEGATPLAAFDAALEAAGLHDYNVIHMSSILPPGSRVTVARPSPPADHYGRRLYAVVARQTVHEPGHEASAGLGWAQRPDGRGLFVEGVGMGERGVRENLEASLDAITARRGGEWGEFHLQTATVQCEDHPVCAVVAAAYGSRDWR